MNVIYHQAIFVKVKSTKEIKNAEYMMQFQQLSGMPLTYYIDQARYM